MNGRLRAQIAIGIGFVLATVLFLSAQAPARTGLAAIDAVLSSAVNKHATSGVVAIVADRNGILYQGSAGFANAKSRKAMRPDTIFRIASMTKPVTAVAIMMLQEQGKLSVEDPIANYLPAFRNIEVVDNFDEVSGRYSTRKPAEELRIRHLLSNTSGFGYAFSSAQLKRMRDKSGKATDDLPLLHDPGARWTYGMSARLLGNIVEKVSGKGLDQFFTERIFSPLGMRDTFYLVPSAKLSRVATVNHRSSQGGIAESANPKALGSRAVGDGGLYSTAGDYVIFLQMLLNDGKWHGTTFLTKASVDAMTQNQIGGIFVETQQTTDVSESRNFPMNPGVDKFGFGFQIAAGDGAGDLRSPGSYSWAGSYNTHFWVDPKRGIAAVLMMQLTPFYDDGAMNLLQEFERTIGRTYSPPR